jgi:hypothetical protein
MRKWLDPRFFVNAYNSLESDVFFEQSHDVGCHHWCIAP